MHLVYIDDSGDEKTRCYSALVIPETVWKSTLEKVLDFRRALKASDGILITLELHATIFVGGRGRVGPNVVPKFRRCEIFRQTLSMIAALPQIRLFNAIGPRASDRLIFERLLMRVSNTMKSWKSNAIIIHDEGKDYTYLVRKMAVYNPVKSMYGCWDDGKEYRNITTDHIVEDIIFRDSKRSSLIQLSDFCAYALFRSEFPLASKAKYGINDAFNELHAICIREAFGKDHRGLGIIRNS